MQAPPKPEEYQEKLKKRGRIQKLEPKVHQIAKEEGRGLKSLWQKIIERSRKVKVTQPSRAAGIASGDARPEASVADASKLKRRSAGKAEEK